MIKKRTKLITIIFAIIVVVILLFFLIINWYKEFKETEELHNDYSRASIIYSLSFYKNFNDLYNNIRLQQGYEKYSNVYSEIELIENFKEYDIIWMLNYINYDIVDKQALIDIFKQVFLFIEATNIKYNISGESLFTRNENGVYFKIEDNQYCYQVNKKIVSSAEFKRLINLFTKIDSKEYLYNQLWNNEVIRKYYLFDGVNYYRFKQLDLNSIMQQFPNEMNGVILNMLKGFAEFLTTKVYNKDSYSFDIELNLEEIELIYRIEPVQNLYNDLSEYYTKLYKVDLEDVWEQLKEYKLPKLYL